MASPSLTVQSITPSPSSSPSPSPSPALGAVLPLSALHTFPPIRRVSYSRKCILALIANGYSNREIKETLEYSSEQVVKNMVREIYTRLGVQSGHSRNRVLVARWYIEVGQFLPTKDPIVNL